MELIDREKVYDFVGLTKLGATKFGDHYCISMADIVKQPVVEAIPTEWLKEWFGNNYNAFTDMMTAWKEYESVD